MTKKKPIRKGLESFKFKIFLNSLTNSKIRELKKRYNELILAEETSAEKFKGYAKLGKEELIDKIKILEI